MMKMLQGMVLLVLGCFTFRAGAETTYAELAPLFQQKCVLCHSARLASAGLRLDNLEAILAGSSRGPVVEKGNPAGSELVRRVRGTSQPRMPLTGPPFLSESEIALIEDWIAGGLQAGASGGAVPPVEVAPRRPGPGEPVTYAHVAPIFAARCVKCHTDNGLMGPAPEGFTLTSYEAVLASADRARVVPGNPGASDLLRRIRGQALPRMPFDGPPYLDEADIRLVEDWIAQGARNSAGEAAPVPAGARLRLHGRLGHGWTLDGLELQVDGRTRIDKRPLPGDYVQVRGRLDGRGRVIVERLRRR